MSPGLGIRVTLLHTFNQRRLQFLQSNPLSGQLLAENTPADDPLLYLIGTFVYFRDLAIPEDIFYLVGRPIVGERPHISIASENLNRITCHVDRTFRTVIFRTCRFRLGKFHPLIDTQCSLLTEVPRILYLNRPLSQPVLPILKLSKLLSVSFPFLHIRNTLIKG